MKIIVHRGTNQIGGCLTEIKSNSGTKILIDIGANLPDSDGKIKPEMELEGLTTINPAYDAIFITHYHGDHIGLYNRINENIPIYIGKISKGIYTILQKRLSKADIVSKEDLNKIESFNTFTIKDKIKIHDIVITPIGTDHSAFDSYMFLIEADNKKILHTGDFRTHGQRGKKVLDAIKKYVGEVDCLICEGTTLTRNEKEYLTENQLQIKAQNIFENNKYNFILCSSTNIDRIAAFHKATLNSHKMFICDKYQCEILEYVSKNARSSLYKFNEGKESKVYCYGDNMLNKMQEYGFVMLVRANDKFKDIMANFKEYHFIYSQWLGYLKGENKDYKRIQDFTPENFEYLHTSGHATKEAIKQVIDVTNPKVVIPIHTEGKEKIAELTDKAVILEDNEEFIIE
jgi:ribonuclease J